MQHQQVEIVNKLGLHARAAAKLVTLAQTFSADIRIGKNGQQVNGKSIMGVMMLAAGLGAQLELTTDGPDEQEAAAMLAELVAKRFGEAQ